MIVFEDDQVWVMLCVVLFEVYDVVLVIVFLGVLKEGGIGFKLVLFVVKCWLILCFGMGFLDKVYLQFDCLFWDKDVIWIYMLEVGGECG